MRQVMFEVAKGLPLGAERVHGGSVSAMHSMPVGGIWQRSHTAATILKLARTFWRGLWVCFWIARAALEFLLFVGIETSKRDAGRRVWLRRTARNILRAMNVKVSIEGFPPTGGLLVSNHLSYLDILVLASLTPATFVSKQDVAGWPVFGWLAKCAGTIFVKRERRADVGRVSHEISLALHSGALVVLFPEGTSSSGQTVLPFRSSLLEPVFESSHPVHAAALDYHLSDGSVEEEVCYWGDMVLGPHLLNLLSKKTIHATVRFGGPERNGFTDRKQLAKSLQESVLRLRSSCPEPEQPLALFF